MALETEGFSPGGTTSLPLLKPRHNTLYCMTITDQYHSRSMQFFENLLSVLYPCLTSADQGGIFCKATISSRTATFSEQLFFQNSNFLSSVTLWKNKTRVTSCELRVQIYELQVQIQELLVKIQELRLQIHELGRRLKARVKAIKPRVKW